MDEVKNRRDKFIERAEIKFDNRFDYSGVQYVNMLVEVDIRCREHGTLSVKPGKHLSLKSGGCEGCYRDSLTSAGESTFIRRARETHGDRYSYGKVVYVNAKTRVCISCPDHGDFQQAPGHHVNGSGCPGCWSDRRHLANRGKSRVKPTKGAGEFLEKLGEIPSFVSIDTANYIGVTKGTVTVNCDLHGATESVPDRVLKRRSICPKCGNDQGRKLRTRSAEEARVALERTLGPGVEIDMTGYGNQRSLVRVTCGIHGEFTRSFQKLMLGQDCSECRMERNRNNGSWPGSYNETILTRNSDLAEKPAFVYYLKVGDLYKIGITQEEKLRRRLSSIRSSSGGLPVVMMDKYLTTLYEAYAIEQRVLQVYSEHRISTEWSTEVFSQDVLRGRSLNIL